MHSRGGRLGSKAGQYANRTMICRKNQKKTSEKIQRGKDKPNMASPHLRKGTSDRKENLANNNMSRTLERET